MSTKLYDPALVVLTWGPNLISGLAEGTAIEVTRDEPAMQKKVGNDGEVGRARNKNRAGKVKITLMGTSASNDVFSAAANNDETLGTGAMPLMLKDLLGTTLLSAQNAWVLKKADYKSAKEISDFEWTLDCDLLSGNVGGSNVGP